MEVEDSATSPENSAANAEMVDRRHQQIDSKEGIDVLIPNSFFMIIIIISLLHENKK